MKSILVIDTPNSCNECEFKGYKSENVQYTCCSRLDYCLYDNMLENGKFKNCPLQDTTELLQELEKVIAYAHDSYYSKEHESAHNKLYKSLGGLDNE